jgi:hypothetical protein
VQEGKGAFSHPSFVGKGYSGETGRQQMFRQSTPNFLSANDTAPYVQIMYYI